MPKKISLKDQVPLRQAVDLLRESFMVTDVEIDRPGPRILYVNQAFEKLTGYTKSEVIGRTPRFLQGPLSDRAVLDRLRRCLEERVPFSGETVNYRKDGTPFVMDWSIESVVDPDSGVECFVALQRDVSELHKQRALRRVVHQLSDSVVIFNRQGRVTYANDAYLSWSHETEEGVLGQPIWTLAGSPMRRSEVHWARRMLSKGASWQREFATRRPGIGGDAPEPAFLFASISPVESVTAGPGEFVAIARDVTERRRLEAIAEAYNLYDNLGFVFSGIRHELGNPINSLKAALTLVSDSVETMSRERLGDYLQRMAGEVERVEYLLRSLRTYNLFQQPRMENLDVKRFAASFQRIVWQDAQKRRIRFEVEISRAVDQVFADPQALNQVLLNLFSNAAEAVSGEPEPVITLSVRRQRERVLWTMADNGTGLSKEQLAHLFKPFYTTRRGGTGLGLAITRRLMSLMGGTIELRNGLIGAEACLTLEQSPPRSFR